MLRGCHEEGSAAKPIIIDDDVEMTASPDLIDFSVSEKVLRAPHRHSKHAPHIKPAAALERSRKRGRAHGGYGRSEMEHEITAQLQEYHDEEMDLDEHVALPSAAVSYATQYLLPTPSNSSDNCLSFLDSSPLTDRVALRHPGGNKRSCIPAESSVMDHQLYREVV
jgi:hypothetical protein